MSAVLLLGIPLHGVRGVTGMDDLEVVGVYGVKGVLLAGVLTVYELEV